MPKVAQPDIKEFFVQIWQFKLLVFSYVNEHKLYIYVTFAHYLFNMQGNKYKLFFSDANPVAATVD